jgi:hypothetical protein
MKDLLSDQIWEDREDPSYKTFLTTEDTQKSLRSSVYLARFANLTIDARQLYTACECQKAGKRKGHPATGRPFLSRENSSNGGKAVKTFWRNLMSLKTGVSSDF